MSRNVSAALNAAILAQESDKVILTLLEISHDDLPSPLRLVNDHNEVVSGGETYSPYYFAMALPQDENGKFQSVRLVLDNTDRQLVFALRSISSPATVSVKVVLADSPDTVEIALSNMVLRNVTYDVGMVSGELIFEERLSAQVPGLTFTPAAFPGIF